MELVVGQTVIIEKIGNAVRYCKPDQIFEYAHVINIGRKWFTLDRYEHTRFDLEFGRNDGKGYCSDYQVIVGFNSIEELVEYRKKKREIQEFFSSGKSGKLDYKEINKINGIIEEYL